MNASNDPRLAIPKGPPRKRVQARKRRQERAVKTDVRAQCVARDGYCRAANQYVGPCAGQSELAHLGEHRRFKTRGQAPERRHTTAGAVMLCTRHHRMYDSRRLSIEPCGFYGADGELTIF